MIKNPLLSICIPTYNRCKYLKKTLSTILRYSKKYESLIEIIVSDNCSTDDTRIYVEVEQSKYANLYYYRNSNNEGATSNFLKLTDTYAKGYYCWLIGDDDVINENSLDIIIPILQQYTDIDFFVMNFSLNKQSEKLIKFNLSNIYIGTFIEIINSSARSSNLFAGFISSCIYKLSPYKLFNKDGVGVAFSNFYSTLPHSCIFAKIYKESRAMYIDAEMLTANYVLSNESWSKKYAQLFYLKFMPEMLNYYGSLGYKREEMSNLYRITMHSALFQLFGNKPYCSKIKIKFLFSNIFNHDFYSELIVIINKKYKL